MNDYQPQRRAKRPYHRPKNKFEVSRKSDLAVLLLVFVCLGFLFVAWYL